MIRSNREYESTVARLAEERTRLKEQRAKLVELGLSKEEMKRVLDPLQSFHEQLREEVDRYERLKRGEFEELRNFEGLGRLLIALRIARNLSQRELADRLAVHVSQVCRDERNEYHGITVERANRVLEALGADVTSHVESMRSAPPDRRGRVPA